MKRIIVNGRFLIHRITGVERYAREILLELDKLIKPGEIELAIPPDVAEFPDYKNIKVVKVGRLQNRLWEHISFPAYVKKRKAISLNLCNVAPLLSPDIVCIHDVKIKARPQDFSKKFLHWYNLLFSNACKRSKKIITVSEFSKKEICKYYGVSANHIVVIPNAWQHYKRIGYDDHTLEKYDLTKDEYYFSMSSMEPNKNFRWIAEAATRSPNDLFAVAGSVNKTVFVEGLGFECPSNMKLLGYVSDEEAKTLMRESKAFIFPSYYEGFGIPPLEAISAGCKNVVVSNTEVMHEIFGEKVCYIDPNDYTSMRKLQMVNKIEADLLNDYSWNASAEKLYCILKKIGNQRKG